MKIIAFEPEHLDQIDVQPKQLGSMSILADHPDYGASLKQCGDAYTVVVAGKPVVCAGVIRLPDGRGLAWALFSGDSGRFFVRLCRYIRRYLEACGTRRVEATIDVRHVEGVRLAKLMGFEVEGVARKYGADGGDHYLMARVS